MKRSMYLMLLERLGLGADQAVYLDDTGHMSGVDSLFGLDRAAREGRLADGDLVLLLSAGTGYTWAASVVRWGPFGDDRGAARRPRGRPVGVVRDPAVADRHVRGGDR